MVKENDWTKLKFEKVKVEFKDERKMIAGQLDGIFTREEIKTHLQEISDALAKKDRKTRIGVATHYKVPNDWLPAVFTEAGQPEKIFDPSDSDATNTYVEPIDSIYIYIVEKNDTQVFMTLKKIFKKMKKTKYLHKTFSRKRLKNKNI